MSKLNPPRILSRGGAGTRVIPDTAVAFDLPDDTQEPNAAVKAPSDPVGLAARLMLETALNANPDSREMFRKEGLAVVVEVPSACWITPISEALYELASVAITCLETDKESDFQNYFDVNWKAIKADGLKSTAERAKIDAAVVRAIADGVTVVGFSQAPNRFLPPSLLRAADHRIVVSPLSSEELAYAVSQMLGGSAEESLSPRLCRLIDTDDLRLAELPPP